MLISVLVALVPTSSERKGHIWLDKCLSPSVLEWEVNKNIKRGREVESFFERKLDRDAVIFVGGEY